MFENFWFLSHYRSIFGPTIAIRSTGGIIWIYTSVRILQILRPFGSAGLLTGPDGAQPPNLSLTSGPFREQPYSLSALSYHAAIGIVTFEMTTGNGNQSTPKRRKRINDLIKSTFIQIKYHFVYSIRRFLHNMFLLASRYSFFQYRHQI